MSGTYYQPGSRRASRVNELFAAIAHRYDRINNLQSFGMHHRWKRRVVALAGVGSGSRVLDVCCGTGDISELLAATGART
ncbi:MAG TPA: bifunctional demethylmenaquinone methyltransferase/2-methoxy-6-polyprenyl-1,4-benzoquinol methylase UbiE, partial [Verrucomicrobiales bacterium]|nr:bifunctional demethylmenaquinone methyltransferase/2-methoxy-6-polyprenyl-1,4-benzoquinol methylase UbiE [Verrucomicrobiales bacterium]